jgi:hypothetical protein
VVAGDDESIDEKAVQVVFFSAYYTVVRGKKRNQPNRTDRKTIASFLFFYFFYRSEPSWLNRSQVTTELARQQPSHALYASQADYAN